VRSTTTTRRSHPRRLGTVGLLCLVVLGACLAGPLRGARADAPQVTIVTPSGAGHALSLEALAGSEDVVGRTYTLRSAGSETTQTVTGFSIAALLEASGIDPYSFSYLEVQRPSGGAVQLSHNQALEANAFPDGPPVVYATEAGTGFLRPSAGAEDANAGDSFEAPQGLTINLRKGASLQVRIEASTRRVATGEKVKLRAIVERAGSGEELAYSWYFDDGNSAEGEAVSHSWAKPGSYSVVVGVTAAGEDTGTSAVVRIQVGKAPEEGPDRKGGGHNKSANAPDHGPSDGPSGSSTPSPEPTSTTPPEASAATVTPTPSPEPARTKSEQQQPEKKAAQKKKQPSGDLVSGELLAGEVEEVAPTATRQPQQQAAARTGSPQAQNGGGVPGAALGLGAVVALLGLGALAEAGRFVDLIPRITERLR
jgi:hypothetical protein